jgi:hypothetical protein
MLLRAIFFLLPLTVMAADPYLFAFFRSNGETGVYFAASTDARHWTPLNNDQPVLKPEHPGMLMRDPFLTRGPDKTWHMVWTTGWSRPQPGAPLTIGHASSQDLLHWSPQQLIEIPLANARNAWAPELVWDPARRHWIIFWASTIPGRFPDTEGTGDTGYNHRIYSCNTKDFKTFSEPASFFDPGFNSIDSTIVKAGKRWLMVFKDERKTPLQKKLRLAFAASPAGPWTGVTEPFSLDWVEGPSALKTRQGWLIFFDHYSKPNYYGAYLTRDWKRFEDVSKALTFPEHPRHGSFVRIDNQDLSRLKSSH